MCQLTRPFGSLSFFEQIVSRVVIVSSFTNLCLKIYCRWYASRADIYAAAISKESLPKLIIGNLNTSTPYNFNHTGKSNPPSGRHKYGYNYITLQH